MKEKQETNYTYDYYINIKHQRSLAFDHPRQRKTARTIVHNRTPRALRLGPTECSSITETSENPIGLEIMLIPARIPTGPTDVESSSYGDTNLFWLLEIRQHRRFSCLFGPRRSGGSYRD